MPRASKTGVRGLFRGADGRYTFDLRWREPGTGEYRRLREQLPAGISAAAAKDHARRQLSAALAGGFDPKREAPRRLGELVEEYTKWSATNRPRTLRDRKSLAKILLAGLGDVRLDELSPFHVERFKRDRAGEDAAPATINRAVAQLKHMLGKAAEWGWTPEAKARAIRDMKPMREPPGRVRYLTPAEELALFGALPERVKPLVMAALLSGMRMAEIVNLRKDAVDLAKREITLLHTKNNRVRRVPVNDELAAVLEAAMKASTFEYVFQNKTGRRFTHAATTLYRNAVAKAGIADLHFHDLRHDFATKLRRNGVGIDAIAALLGHTSLAMTQRYAHIGSDTLRAAVAALPSPVAQPLPNTPTADGAKVLEFPANSANR